MAKGSTKITCSEWQAERVLKNSRLWRRQDKQGRWHYYRTNT